MKDSMVQWLISAVLLLIAIGLGTPGLIHAAETAGKDQVALPAGTLRSEEITALFSNRTVYTITAVKGRTSVSYYAQDGGVRQMRNGIKRSGHWRVTENDRMCLQMENLPEKCRIIVAEKDGYKKYIVRKNGFHQLTIIYQNFVEGNILGL